MSSEYDNSGQLQFVNESRALLKIFYVQKGSNTELPDYGMLGRGGPHTALFLRQWVRRTRPAVDEWVVRHDQSGDVVWRGSALTTPDAKDHGTTVIFTRRGVPPVITGAAAAAAAATTGAVAVDAKDAKSDADADAPVGFGAMTPAADIEVHVLTDVPVPATWRYGLCDCLRDANGGVEQDNGPCTLACLLPPIANGMVWGMVQRHARPDRGWCCPCVVGVLCAPLFMAAPCRRHAVRTAAGIECACVDCVSDLCAITPLCCCCALTQEYRQMQFELRKQQVTASRAPPAAVAADAKAGVYDGAMMSRA